MWHPHHCFVLSQRTSKCLLILLLIFRALKRRNLLDFFDCRTSEGGDVISPSVQVVLNGASVVIVVAHRFVLVVTLSARRLKRDALNVWPGVLLLLYLLKGGLTSASIFCKLGIGHIVELVLILRQLQSGHMHFWKTSLRSWSGEAFTRFYTRLVFCKRYVGALGVGFWLTSLTLNSACHWWRSNFGKLVGS